MPCILEMPRVDGDDIQYKLEEINSFLAIRYKMDHPKKERNIMKRKGGEVAESTS